MAHDFTFIDREDYADYTDSGGGVSRLVEETPVKPVVRSADASAEAEPRDLTDVVCEQMTGLHDKYEGEYSAQLQSNWFGCACVEVKSDDGMSWSAEAVRLRLQKEYPHYKPWLLTSVRDTGSPSAISDCIGLRNFLHIAGEHKFGSVFITGGNLMPYVFIGVAAVLAVIVALFDYVQKNNLSGRPVFILVVSALLGVAAKYVAPYVAIKTFPDKLRSLNEALASVATNKEETGESEEDLPGNYQDFIGGVAARMAGEKFPRFVIIDNYGNQDPTTKRVIIRYFREYVKRAEGGEFWVVFEGQYGEKFSNAVTKWQQFGGFQSSRTYRQLFISDEERRRLVEQEHLPQAALEYRSIKFIRKSDGATKSVEHAKKVIDDQLKGGDKDDATKTINYLYLLSLTASRPDHFFMDVYALEKKLSHKTGTRAEVLRQFLVGSRLVETEFSERRQKVETKFPSLIETRKKGKEKSLHIEPGAAGAFAECAKAWELPQSGLGHLFWSLYWLADQSGKQVEAFWIGKLAHHLKQSEPALLDVAKLSDPATQAKIVKDLFNGILSTSNNCMKTCMFEDIPPMLRKAYDLIDGGDMPNDRPSRERLSQRCWEAYSLLGRDEILETILDLSGMAGEQPPPDAPEQQDLLFRLFFESTPLASSDRASLRPDLLSRLDSSRRASESIYQYAQARSAWLTLTLSPFLISLEATELRQAVTHADNILDDLAEKTVQRIGKRAETGVLITDILTLSLALWCSALRMRPEARFITGADPGKNFAALLDAATGAVLKATEIKEQSAKYDQNSLGWDFLSNGLVRELYVVTLASVITAYRSLPPEAREAVTEQQVKFVNDIIKYSRDLIDFPLDQVRTRDDILSDSLFRQTDGMLTFCEFLWDRFGFERLRDFMNIRRVHFNVIGQGFEYKKEVADDAIRESLSAALDERSFTGLIANVMIANCLKQVEDIEAHYLRRAGRLVSDYGFGPRLKRELSLIVINETHATDSDPTQFLENLLESDGQEAYLQQALRRIDAGSVKRWLLVLHNVSLQVKRPEIIAKLKETMDTFLGFNQLPEVRQEVEPLLEVFDLQEKLLRQDALNVGQIIEAWQGKKGSIYYLATLNTLLRYESTNAHLYRESVAALRDRDAAQDAFNFPLLLAWRLLNLKALRGQNGDLDLQPPVTYLRAAIEKWKSELPAKLNLSIYRTLFVRDEAHREYYFAEMEKWQYNALLGEHLEFLAALVKSNQYFLVFNDYFQTMIHWGLGVEGKSATNGSQEDRAKLLREWFDADGTPPSPLEEKSVSASFLELGNILFSESFSDDPTFDEARSGFNQAAHDTMSKLIDIIVELPALPDSIKNLLKAYSQRLLRYTPA